MDGNVDWLLLERWCADECSPEEAAAIQRWINADAANARQAMMLRATWVRAGNPGAVPPRDAAAVWSELAPKLRPSRERVLRLLPAKSPMSIWLKAGMGIAAALLLVGGGFATWRSFRWAGADTSMASRQQVATGAGQRSVVTLGDGTRVTVGVASNVRFAPTFGRTRDVYLDGEAFFEVAHDPTKPFIVHTTRGTARALGTKFDVEAYGDSPDMSVLVTEGAVAFKGATAADDSLVLHKADLGQLHADGRLRHISGADTVGGLAWMRGELVFDRTPVPLVTRRLARWYGLDVRVGDSTLVHHAISASLTGQSTATALQTVAVALNARIERRGATYLFFSRR